MLFNTLAFILFFPIVTTTFLLGEQTFKFRNMITILCRQGMALVLCLIGFELCFGGWIGSESIARLGLLHDRKINLQVIDPVSGLERDISYNLDKFAMRGPYSTPEDIFVMTVGGSTTAQRDLGDGETWQDYLSHYLIKVGLSGEVANAGQDGQSTDGHINSFRRWFPLIPKLKPKYILFYVGVNDLKMYAAVDDIPATPKLANQAVELKQPAHPKVKPGTTISDQSSARDSASPAVTTQEMIKGVTQRSLLTHFLTQVIDYIPASWHFFLLTETMSDSEANGLTCGTLRCYVTNNSAIFRLVRQVQGDYLARKNGVIYFAEGNTPPDKTWTTLPLHSKHDEIFAGFFGGFKARLTELVIAARSMNSIPIIVTQSTADWVKEGDMIKGTPKIVHHYQGKDFNGRDFYEIFRYLSEVTLKVCGETGTTCFDMFRELPLTTADVCGIHNTRSGSRKIGQYLGAKFAELEQAYAVTKSQDAMKL